MDAVEQVDAAVHAVYPLDDIAVLVFCQFARLLVEVAALAHQLGSLLGAVGSLDVEADACLRIALAQYDFLQIEVAVGGSAAFLRDALYLYLLHQMLVVGIDGVQAIHHVVDVALSVGGTI